MTWKASVVLPLDMVMGSIRSTDCHKVSPTTTYTWMGVMVQLQNPSALELENRFCTAITDVLASTCTIDYHKVSPGTS